MSFANFKTGAGAVVDACIAVKDGGAAWLTEYDALKGNSPGLTGDEYLEVHRALSLSRVALQDWNNRAAEGLRVWLRYVMGVIGRPALGDQAMMDDLVRFMAANGHYVAAREVTYGANPADNVVGIHRRFTVNQYGEKIESGMHAFPTGIAIRVRDSEASGVSGIQVVYEGEGGQNASSLRITGVDFSIERELVGPRNGGLATNPLLNGNEATTDGADITDGTAATGGIRGWNQTRTGSPTVKCRPGDAFGEQTYGVGIGGASATFQITQGYAAWRMQGGLPVATMIPAKQDGAAWEGDITWEMGGVASVWDETDLSNGVYVPLITDLDEGGYAENFDDEDDLASLTIAMDAFSDGGEEVILGGIYVAQAFQLQPGGEYHVCWERGVEPGIGDEVRYGADSQTDAGDIQECFMRAFPLGPSLPITGSTQWTL